jgi:ubiquinone biosynthesis protein UbiJ
MSIGKTRGFLYWLARLLGDVSAVQKSKVARRVTRRLAGKATGKVLRKLFK